MGQESCVKVYTLINFLFFLKSKVLFLSSSLINLFEEVLTVCVFVYHHMSSSEYRKNTFFPLLVII